MPTLVVQYPTGHKASIDVPANKPLIKALEIACSRRSLDPSKHIFVHNRRPVDLTVIFRYSGLVNNAAVELVLDESNHSAQLGGTAEIRLCFRLEGGQRVLWSGTPTTPLWSILTELAEESSEIKNLLFEGEEETVGPMAIIYLQEQIVGKSSLQMSTPADLGVLRGSALFQLHRFPAGHPLSDPAPVSKPAETRQPVGASSETAPYVDNIELPMETTQPSLSDPVVQEDLQMHVDKPEPVSGPVEETGFVSPFSVFAERPTQSVFGQTEKPDSLIESKDEPKTLGALLGITLEPGAGPADAVVPQVDPGFQFNQFKFPEETAGVDLRGQGSDEQTTAADLNVDRECIAFRLPLATEITSTDDDLPDEFFEHTEADLRNILQAYRNEWASNQQLQTAAMRKSAREQLYHKYPRAIIQFHWADGIVLQACFHPRERVSELYNFVQQNLRHPQPELQLYTTPPKIFLKNKDQTLIEANLVPMTKVYISPQSLKAEEVLQPELISATTTANMQHAREVVAQWMQPLTSKSHSSQVDSTTVNNGVPVTNSLGAESRAPKPKWLKLGK